ncbi:hypothetical protein TW84_15155 [Vibrio neptunius]|uniref:hypothetical protein n=1 Tax=Vibrio neptunius TaxID=170651 RepID=UPI0005FA674F|nr:hypothetical protein [Vibrio neptunius]KJY88451.1 hypothetical protein TW84_15155 [Vibrio neptunius]
MSVTEPNVLEPSKSISENVAPAKGHVTGFLGATFAQFAARNLANAALNSFSVPLAKTAKSLFLRADSSTRMSPNDYLEQNFVRIFRMTRQIYQNVNDIPLINARNLLQSSLSSFEEIITNDPEGDYAQMNYDNARYAVTKCKEALAIFDDHSDNQEWIGAYFTAASQYCFICRQILQYQKDNIFVENVIAKENVLSQIDKSITYVTQTVNVNDMIKAVSNKVAEVRYNKGSTHPWGFRYYLSEDKTHYKTLANKTKDGMTECSDAIRQNAIDLLETQIIQPDVVRSWELIKLAIEEDV